MAGGRVLRGGNNAFTAGNGHYPGATPGTREEPGDRPLARVPGPGGRRAAKTRQLASRRGEAGHGPSISYMEGPCLILPAGTCCRVRHLRQLRNAGRDDLGSGRAGRASTAGGRLGTRAACPAGCAASMRCPPSGTMSSRRRPDPRPGCGPPPAIPGTLTRCLPAWHENVLQALLCITMWITCVKRCRACAHIRKCWGFRCRVAPVTGPSPGRARSAPCGRRRKRNRPHATPR
jgi:hypothetical protein